MMVTQHCFQLLLLLSTLPGSQECEDRGLLQVCGVVQEGRNFRHPTVSLPPTGLLAGASPGLRGHAARLLLVCPRK